MNPFEAARLASERTREREYTRKNQLRKFRESTVQRIREQELKTHPRPQKQLQIFTHEAWIPLPRDEISIVPDTCPATTDTSMRPVSPKSRDDDTHLDDSRIVSPSALIQDTFAEIPILPDTQINRDWAQASLLATF
mmetsp:Transcript_12220/g.16515  ORF Transcript_12220/g.16515 Transcript_12220/m.16515 type:complete len:137 (-) Transcript_12220:150-560(-)